jgi:hypothetical protein
MVDAAQLKELRRLTNGSLSDCKRALDESNGNLFAAAVSMLTEDDVHALKSSMMVRSSAGQSIKDPVTASERELIGALEAHFIAQRTRPVNVGFLFETTSLFLADSQFRNAVVDNASEALHTVWRALAGHNTDGSSPHAETVKTPKNKCTVVTMPEAQSEWECDYIVLIHPRRRFLLSSSARVIAIYKRTKRPDRGVANIEEMAGQGGDVRPVRRWVHENAVFTPIGLAQTVLDHQLREVT